MNFVVCVKRVAATDTQVKVGADGKSLDPAGVEFVLNPYDEFAVEQALLIKEQLGEGEVTILTLGPQDAQKELRNELAKGADKAVLLKTDGWVYDSYSAAKAIAQHLEGNKPDLVFCGKQAVDADNAQFGPRLAALLGMPSVSEVAKLSFENGTFTVERDIEGGREVISVPAPAVVTCNKGLNEPRYTNLKGIMKAKKKPLDIVDAPAIEPAMENAGLELPPARPEGRILGEGAGAVSALMDALRNEAKVL